LKKLFFIFFAVFFCLQLLNYAPIIRVWQYVIRHKVEKMIAKNLPNEYLHKITVSNSEKLTWEKPQKDFWYKGYLYDVVRTTQTQDSITYYCLQDLKETQLLKIFAQKDNHSSSTTANSILSWDFAKKVVALDDYKILLPPITYIHLPYLSSQLQGYYANHYAFLHCVIIDSPPEV